MSISKLFSQRFGFLSFVLLAFVLGLIFLSPGRAAAVQGLEGQPCSSSSHNATIIIHAYDVDAPTATISGVKVIESRDASDCPNKYGRFIADRFPGKDPNVDWTGSGGGITFYDSCYTPKPYFKFEQTPGNYDFDHVDYYLGTAAVAGEKPMSLSAIWSNSKLNEKGGMRVKVFYKNTVPPPDWKLVGDTDVDKSTVYPGEAATFTHRVHNNGPNTATYQWSILKNYPTDNITSTSGWPELPLSKWSVPAVTTAKKTNSPDYKKTETIPTAANDGDDYCQQIQYKYATGPGTAKGHNAGDCATVRRPSAICTISTSGYGPSNEVIAGRPINGSTTITNTTSGLGDIPSSIGAYSLEVVVSDTASDAFSPTPSFSRSPGGVTSGSFSTSKNGYTVPVTGSVTVTIRYYSASASPNLLFNLGSCTASPSIYVPFTLTPHADQPLGDVEYTNSIPYKTSVDNSALFTVKVSGSSRLYKDPATNPSLASSAPSPSQDLAASVNTPVWGQANYTSPGLAASLAAGDKYCSAIHIDIRKNGNTQSSTSTSGYRGPASTSDFIFDAIGIYSGIPSDATSGCLKIHNEPYIHVVNSDASAGGGFGDSCTPTPGGIKTYNRKWPNSINPAITGYSGSGAQFAAIARDTNRTNAPINGFSSAILRASAQDPLAPIGISFANSPPPGASSAHDANLGGNFDESHCVPDYFSRAGASGLTNSGSGNIAINTSDAKLYTGPVTIDTTNIPNGQNSVVYVKGDVYIKGTGIRYSGSAGWNNLTTTPIPSLFVIAKGNIYIDPTVTQLDGVFVAQPETSSTGGHIYTCANGFSSTPPTTTANSWLKTCTNQLIVNGAFVAQNVAFQRTSGSLWNSSVGEKYKPGAATHPCREGVASSDCAAEIFRYSPELYLANPAFPAQTGPTTGKYDYITSLSPVL